MIDYSKFEQLFNKQTRPDKRFTYGTAGFREKGYNLQGIVFAVGILAVLRSLKLNGKCIGVMVTASHNPPEDNGVKIVEPLGEMLITQWENYATNLANIREPKKCFDYIQELINEQHIKVDSKINPLVYFARDTRESGPTLINSLKDGIQSINGTFQDYGLLTTPQLHYLIRATNTQNTKESYGEATELGYYKKLSQAYKKLITNPKNSKLTVDCANGIGAPKLTEMLKYLDSETIDIKVANGDVNNTKLLNMSSGADYVKVNQKFPQNIQPENDMRYCAFDGDADRIVYFYKDKDSNNLKLLDGDKISTLLSMYIVDLIKNAGLNILVGVVQTAYANGSSTEYLKNVLKLPVSCVQTGVKHLHHEAEKYDVGVYFEANGHGTVLFNTFKIQSQIEKMETQTPAQKEAIQRLTNLIDLVNQTVGDAVSDMLVIEAILNSKQWSLNIWDNMYTDLPNKLMKITVKDRHIFKTIKADTELQEPINMQHKINEIVKKYNRGRSFVRPSGTEDCVRIYAEALTFQECNDLAYQISLLVYEEGNGTGSPPAKFLSD